MRNPVGFRIVRETNPILRNKCSNVVVPIDNKIKKLIKKMIKFIKFENKIALEKSIPERGVAGLAAPQIGKNLNMFAVVLQNGRHLGFINPVILKRSEDTLLLKESCLSVEQKNIPVVRSKEIEVRAYIFEKDQLLNKEMVLRGFDARVFLHEYDHLQGILITDYLDDDNEEIVEESKEETPKENKEEE